MCRLDWQRVFCNLVSEHGLPPVFTLWLLHGFSQEIGAAEAAPRLMAGRICLTTALVAEWGQPQQPASEGRPGPEGSSGPTWEELNRSLWTGLHKWLAVRFPNDTGDAAAARSDAADWLRQWESDREADPAAGW